MKNTIKLLAFLCFTLLLSFGMAQTTPSQSLRTTPDKEGKIKPVVRPQLSSSAKFEMAKQKAKRANTNQIRMAKDTDNLRKNTSTTLRQSAVETEKLNNKKEN